MSTALLLLFILATATAIGTVIPQEPLVPTTVREWRSGAAGPGPTVAQALDVLSLFDVFGSWWFAALSVLLMVSLAGCLWPRYRAFLRNVRRPPAQGRNLSRLTNHVEVPLGSDGLSGAEVRRILAGYRIRIIEAAEPDTRSIQYAAERGHLREAGSLLFHTSFYVLLLGVILGAAFSFTGQIDIVEGESFADTPLGYHQTRSGPLWGPQHHTGQLTRIDDFQVSYMGPENPFMAEEFVSTVTFSDASGEQPVTREIRVNHPVRYNALTYYQRAFGFAPRVVLRSGLDGTVVFDEQVIARPDGAGLWRGRAKISLGSDSPDAPLPQIALELVFIPDATLTSGGFTLNSPEPNDPRLVVTLYSGDDLGLDRTVPLSSLNWPDAAIAGQQMIPLGSETAMVGGLFTVEFAELPMWTGLQVSHQPFRWLMLIGVGLLLAGLIPSLYAYRRRVWLEVDSNRAVLAGVALHRKDRFAEEFKLLSARLRAAAGDQDSSHDVHD